VNLVQRTIPWPDVPRHVQGFILLGCGVAFPHRQIHCFVRPIPRAVDPRTELEMRSLVGQERLAELVRDRFEASSGVRATLLTVGRRDLVVRDGSRRILPFNLLMDRDPPEAGRRAAGVE
jgi:hypothetical protein